jgi:putative nucleotidyltransferase with HDIG domain
MRFRKASPRRQAIREDVAEVEGWIRRVTRRHGHVLFIASVFFLVASAVQFWPWPLLPYREGERATTDIRSPVSFQISDPVLTKHQQEAAREFSPPVIVPTPFGLNRVINQLNALRVDVAPARTLNDVPKEVRDKFGLTAGNLREIQTMDPASYERAVSTFARTKMEQLLFVSAEDFAKLKGYKSGYVEVLAVNGVEAEKRHSPSLAQVMVVGNVTLQQKAVLKSLAAVDMPQGLAEVAASYLAAGLPEPTYKYDAALSAQLAEERSKQVLAGEKLIPENEVIVKAGDVITAESLRMLTAAQGQLEAEALKRNPWAGWLSGLGKILAVALLTAAGAAYVLRMNSGTGATTLRQGWAVCALLLGSLIVARAVVGYWPQSALLSGIAPTLLAAIILVIVYNQRFGLGMAGLHGLLVVLTLGQGMDFYLALMTGAAVFCFGLHEIRTRGKLIEMGFYAGLAIFVAVWALGLARMVGSVWNPWIISTDLKVIWLQSLWGAAGGMVVSMVMSAVLPPVERIFKITTAMTLLELCDANKPLLRRLQQEAPGTFNHSLTVGIMAEAAGNAIGANGLLCRVGAYYHDIGKLSKPQYFIENQTGGGPNRHEKLSPAMSLLIIVGHVKDGIELAREYALPWIVHQFIAQHHGTTLVEYFFHAAKKRKEQEGDHVAEVSETEFRYPGPKPQTREAAIVMICDGCESVVRSIEEPTPGRIEAAVHTMITKRLMDGQFNECDLTLKQLSVIEERLIRTLAGIHHGRVAYPSASATQGDGPLEVQARPA